MVCKHFLPVLNIVYLWELHISPKISSRSLGVQVIDHMVWKLLVHAIGRSASSFSFDKNQHGTPLFIHVVSFRVN